MLLSRCSDDGAAPRLNKHSASSHRCSLVCPIEVPRRLSLDESGRVELGKVWASRRSQEASEVRLLSRPRTCLVFIFRFLQLIHSKWIRAGPRLEACSALFVSPEAASLRVVSCSTFDLSSYSRCFYASGFAYSVPPSICFHPAEFAELKAQPCCSSLACWAQ